MKNRILKLLAFCCSLTLLCTAFFCVPAQALTNDTQFIEVDYQHPTEIVAVEQREKEFILSAKTEKGRINNFNFSFPKSGGVRFHADEEGYFKPDETLKIAYSAEGAAIVMQAGDSKIKLYKTANPWRFEIYNANEERVVYFTSTDISFGYEKGTGNLRKVKMASSVEQDELFYGLGERFGGYILNGKSVEMWNTDCFSQLVRSYGDLNVGYKNIPMLHSNSGYTLFHNNTYYGIVDVADSNKQECSFEFYGPILDLYVWTGTSLQNISRYNELTGNTVLVPKWALSYWAGQASTVWKSSSSEADVIYGEMKEILEKYDEMKTPIKNIFAEGLMTISKYDKISDYLNSLKMHVFGWTASLWHTGDSERTPAQIAEAAGITGSKTPIVKRIDTPQANFWDANGSNFVDYTNPISIRWLSERLRPYMSKGLSGMMVDYNDTVGLDAYYPGNGGTGDYMHNFSAYYYDKAFDQVFQDTYGAGNYINFARAGCAGSQHYTAVFAGDQSSTFLGLKEAISALLSSSSSGINVWGSDIGGLGSPTTDTVKNDPTLYARWLQFGTFSPLMRAHGQTSRRDPWAYDTNGSSSKLFGRYYWTRENLVDLIYSAVTRASVENEPLTKSMMIAYPTEKELIKNETQYLFCDSLLVSPVTDESAAHSKVDFPAGRWVDLWNGKVYEGGETAEVSATLDTIPVFIKAGAAFPVTFGEEIDFGTMNTEDKNVNAIVTAPALEKTESKIYTDAQNFYILKTDKSGENSYTLSSETERKEPIVVLMGCTADQVIKNGEQLEKLSEKPTSVSKGTGYYVDYANNATIVLTGGSYRDIAYRDSTARLANLALNSTVTAKGLSEKITKNLPNAADGVYSDYVELTEKKSSVTFELPEENEVDTVLVKWGGSYAKSYTLSGSVDGENWTDLYQKKKGGGGCDTIDIEKAKYRYFRISDIDNATKKNARLVELEAYGSRLFKEADGQPYAARETKEISKNGENANFYWILFGSIGIAVLIAAFTTAFILIRKKKGVKQ